MIIPINLDTGSYPIEIERGALHRARELFRLDRKVLVVTDSGVPACYAEEIAAAAKEPYLVTVPHGEESKSLSVFEKLLSKMLSCGFSRKDCVVSVGGGVVSDLAGFTAASYMRGIDFYSVPTTVLSAVDASIGGKTALNLDGIKNIVGAFYQPKAVLIDPDTMKTLPGRQVSNGLCEALKMSITSDPELFDVFEQQDPYCCLDEIITRSVMIKKAVVEQDEKEQNLRKVLNFGHTIGHGIESAGHALGLYHGECVAMGMIPMCSKDVQKRLMPVLKKLKLPVSAPIDAEEIYRALIHDKKAAGGEVSVVTVDEIGSFSFRTIPLSSLKPLINIVTEQGEKA